MPMLVTNSVCFIPDIVPQGKTSLTTLKPSRRSKENWQPSVRRPSRPSCWLRVISRLWLLRFLFNASLLISSERRIEGLSITLRPHKSERSLRRRCERREEPRSRKPTTSSLCKFETVIYICTPLKSMQLDCTIPRHEEMIQ